MNTDSRSENYLNELEPASLRQAAEQVRNLDVPEDAADRAVRRAEQSLSAVASVRQSPAAPSHSRFGWWKAAVVVCALTLMVFVGDGMRTALQYSEQARRMQNSNSLKQLGLAVHNYSTVEVPSMLTYSANDGRGEHWFAENGRFRQPVRFATNAPGSMVIHTTNMLLVVSEINKTEAKLRELLDEFEGEISNAQVSEPQGQPRTARWIVKVPSESLDDFLTKATKLGTPENRSVNSQDVTDQYVDLQTRIGTKKELEKRILKLLEEKTGDLAEVLKVEEQLARIREEIERMEGQTQRMDSAVAMSTVEISAREEQDYVPPQAPTFSGEIDATWKDSLLLLEDLGKAVVICGIAIVPWLPLLLIPFLLIRHWLKRRRTGAEK